MGNAIDDYLAPLPKEQRDALEELRRIVRTVVPEVEETIRTRVPAFRYKGRPLVSMGPAKKHLSLFIMYGKVLKTFEDELRGFDTSNTVIRFTPDKRIPYRLVAKLVDARKAEIERSETSKEAADAQEQT